VGKQRQHPRYEVNAYVDVTGHDVLLYHRIRNLSLGGICIQTGSIEPVGTLVDVVITFPELKAELSLRGEVVWANLQHPMDMGIRWFEMTDDQRALLRDYVLRCDAREVSA
jgi:uncharacterized protein (TIGR02266 family)